MLWQSSKANPILSETTDCTPSTDDLYTKRDLLVNLDSSRILNRPFGTDRDLPS